MGVPELTEFARLFDAGEFWAAHEALEGRWRADRDPLWQGLIQVAAAFVHVRKGRAAPALRVVRRALGHLEGRRSEAVDVEAVRRHARALRAELAGGGTGEGSVFALTPLLFSDADRATVAAHPPEDLP